jgi:hypothetical protein
MPAWKNTDEALFALGERFPGYGMNACLIKAAALNSLYSTYVFAITRMAERIHKTLSRPEFRPNALTKENAAQLVECIAALPPRSPLVEYEHDPDASPPESLHRNRRFRSFASKYCAVFINPLLFPILDEAAQHAVKLHLDPDEINRDSDYKSFVA